MPRIAHMNDDIDLSWLSSRAPLIIGVVLAALMLMPAVNLFSVLFGHGTELSYSGDTSFSTCRMEHVSCVTYVEIKLGNTGTEPQDDVEIDLSKFPRWNTVSYGFKKIVASNESLRQPEVSIDRQVGTIRIDRLEVNLMLEFDIGFFGEESYRALEGAEAVIHSRGRVVESDPKATALARAFRTAFAFLL